MIPGPVNSCEARLHGEQHQTGNPCDLGEQYHQNRGLAEHIFRPRERAAEIQWKRAIGDVRRDQAWSGEGGEHKRQHTLHVDEEEKELVIDADGLIGLESRKKTQVVSKIDQDQACQGVEKAEYEERRLELRAEQLFSGIAKQDQAAWPRRRELRGVARVSAPINSHDASPNSSISAPASQFA